MRQSLVQRLNCGTAELQDKEYSECGIRTAELSHSIYFMWKRNCGTSRHIIFCVRKRKRNFKSQNILRVEYLWFLKQWPEWHESAGSTGPWVKAILGVLLFTVPFWRWPLMGFFVCFLRYYQAVTNQLTYDQDPDIRQTSWPKAAGTKLPTGSTRQSKARSQSCKRVLE